MTPSTKLFTERLHHCLDETGAPSSVRERAAILSKLMDIPKHLSFSMLEGNQIPAVETIEKIANEFEVDAKWLCGEE